MANVYDIIIRPIITERSMEATADKKYVFEVAPTAGKIEIKNAVEQIFGVKVAKVNTINYDGKTKRMGAGRPGTRKSWKKAYVWDRAVQMKCCLPKTDRHRRKILLHSWEKSLCS